MTPDTTPLIVRVSQFSLLFQTQSLCMHGTSAYAPWSDWLSLFSPSRMDPYSRYGTECQVPGPVVEAEIHSSMLTLTVQIGRAYQLLSSSLYLPWKDERLS